MLVAAHLLLDDDGSLSESQANYINTIHSTLVPP
jgi:hypothetical protein